MQLASGMTLIFICYACCLVKYAWWGDTLNTRPTSSSDMWE